MPAATGGGIGVSSAPSSAAGAAGVAVSSGAGSEGGGRHLWPSGRQPGELLLRQRPAEVRHRPPCRQEPRCRRLRGDEEELPLVEAADRLVELGHVGRPRGGAEALEHPRLVVRGLQATDQPRAGVRHRLVVEVDGVLRREDEPEPERAPLLEDREYRLLRRRRGARGDVAEDLVHVRERAQVRRPFLTAHPRDELREDERDDELALLLGEVRKVDHGAARLPVGREEERLRVERLALAPGGEGRRGDERVQRERELRPVGGREELVDLEDAELADRRRLDLADQGPEVEVAAGAPRVLDQVREQHVLAARERVGLDPHEREQARHGPFDLVPQRLGIGVPGERRRVERPDDVERDAGGRAGRVDRDVAGVLQRLQALRADPVRREALAPDRRLLRRVLVDGDAGGLRVRLAHPGPEARRLEVREDEREVRHVALRVEHERRDPREARLLEQDDREAGLARARHAGHDPVGRQVARADHDLVGAGLAGCRVDRVADVERAPVRHRPGV